MPSTARRTSCRWASAGGWRFATVLAMEPRLLVLDEPSASLDARSRRELLETLGRLDQTMLVVTHDLLAAHDLELPLGYDPARLEVAAAA